MANKVNLTIAGTDALKEIIVASEGESVFSEYTDKKEIGKKIFNDMYKRTYISKKGFKMLDGSRDVGILSQCQSLQAILLLASEFDLEFDINYSGRENGLTIRQLMDEVIEDLLTNEIKKSDDGRYIFDASPYNTEQFTADFSNIDAIRWVIPTFLLVLKYHAEIHEICKWEDDLIDVIKYGINYINEAFINDTENNDVQRDKLTCGWNFTKDCQEPSLYFTFSICETFLEFFKTFEGHLSYHEAQRILEKSGGLIPIPQEMEQAESDRLAEYEARLIAPDPGYVDEKNKLRKRARFDTTNELVRIYKRINDSEDISGTPYGELEKRCKFVAGEIWRLVKDDLADSFFYNDLKNKVNQEDIRMSTTSDVLFNSVYIINSLIDAGYDEDLMNEHRIALAMGEEKKASAALREYNELLETCQLASQKALRSYDLLKKEGKEYIVDQFLVGFNEKFETHAELIKELRKLRMRVFSLLPLLIRTNNIISEYLVKYPQATMSKYLGYIMENRRIEKTEKEEKIAWIWESDGFFSASNYYYVAALGQFYSYYEKYEEAYIKIYKDNEEDIEKIRSDYKSELESTGDIARLNKIIENLELEIKTKNSEVDKLNEEIQNQKNPVEDAVKEVVLQTLTEQLPSIFCEYMLRVAENYSDLKREKVQNVNFKPEKSERSEEYAEANEFKKAFDSYLISLMSESIHRQILAKKDGKTSFKGEAKKILDENKRCLASYATQIMINDDERSELFKD